MIAKILIGVAAALVAAVVIFVIIVLLQPTDFRISRSLAMAAPPSMVFAQIDDFHKWEAWSPWAKLDPNSKVTFEGPTSGEGAGFTWSGNDKVGQGRQKIVVCKPDEFIQIDLQFEKPFQAQNKAEFSLKPEEKNTIVTWSMYGKNNFMGKAVGLFMDCDKMVGGDFEKGLASMKAIVEAPADTANAQ